jgi:hypothetical protein
MSEKHIVLFPIRWIPRQLVPEPCEECHEGRAARECERAPGLGQADIRHRPKDSAP